MLFRSLFACNRKLPADFSLQRQSDYLRLHRFFCFSFGFRKGDHQISLFLPLTYCRGAGGAFKCFLLLNSSVSVGVAAFSPASPMVIPAPSSFGAAFSISATSLSALLSLKIWVKDRHTRGGKVFRRTTAPNQTQQSIGADWDFEMLPLLPPPTAFSAKAAIVCT